MTEKQGFVIAFHCDQARHPYLGLTYKDRALRTVKPYIPGEIASALHTLGGKEDFDKLLVRISLEAGIANEDKDVLDFVHRKVAKGEPIFLDLTEGDASKHNESPHAQSHFLIASVLVTPNSIALTNAELFSAEEQVSIVSIVKSALFVQEPRKKTEEQRDAATYLQSLCLSNSGPDEENEGQSHEGSEDEDPNQSPFLGSFPFAKLVR
jgi:hypothetical protein